MAYARGPPMSATRPAGGPRARSTSRDATSAVSTGWNRNPEGTGTTGTLAIDCTVVRMRSWNCVERSVVHGRPDSVTTRSAARLAAK